MIQVRQGVFETNSSSTHSICIATRRDAPLDIPKAIHFAANDFEWEYRVLRTPEEKASYLYASIVSLYNEVEAGQIFSSIMDMLEEEDVRCTFDKPVYDSQYGYCVNADVDHAGDNDHRRFVELTVGNKRRLLRYLFSPQSFVMTGNDNSDISVEIHADYPHETYYKGN